MNSTPMENSPLARIAGWIAGALFLTLTVLLLGAARRGHREAAAEARRLESLGREADRTRVENEALRAEIRALEDDPVYIESVLRGRRMNEPGEKSLGK